MRIFIFFLALFFLLPSADLFCQQDHLSRINQIQQILQIETSENEKLNLILEKAQLYFYQMKYDEQAVALEEGLAIAKTMNDSQEVVKIYLKLAQPRAENIETQIRRKEAIEEAYRMVQDRNDKSLFTQVLDAQTELIELSEPRKALQSYLATLQIKKEAQLSKFEIAQSYFKIGNSYISISEPDSSLIFLKKANKILRNEPQNEEVQLLMGDVLLRTGSALGWFKDKKEEVVKINIDSATHIFSTVNSIPHLIELGVTYSNFLSSNGHYAEAMEELSKAFQLSERYVTADILGNMGLLSYYNKNYEESLDYYLKSAEKYKTMDNRENGTIAELSIAFVYSQLKEFEKAFPYLESVQKFAEEKNDLELLRHVYATKGKLNLDMENYEASIKDRKKVISINNQLGDLGQSASQSIVISQISHQVGQLDSAAHYNQIGLSYFEKHPDPHQLLSIHRNFYTIYKSKGDFAQALKNLELTNTYQDSIDKKELQERLNEERGSLKILEAKESVFAAEKEKTLANQEADILASRNRIYLILALGLLSALLIGTYLFNQLRKVKQQLESQNLQLQQLNTTKDKFFGIIAHDIRSPIVALDGVGEQMDFYLKKNKTDKLQRLAGRVDSTAKRLSSLLDNLLNWALLQQGVIPYHPKALDVKEVGEHIFQMFQNNADTKNITLHLQIPDNQKVHADESALNTILRNLVSNAIKFTPKGGTVSLSTETKGDKVFININDTGTGISAEKLSKLFSLEKKSEKGTAGEKGTGLGLTLVKELAELNKGSINVNSVLEKGTTFKLGLPMAA